MRERERESVKVPQSRRNVVFVYGIMTAGQWCKKLKKTEIFNKTLIASGFYYANQ